MKFYGRQFTTKKGRANVFVCIGSLPGEKEEREKKVKIIPLITATSMAPLLHALRSDQNVCENNNLWQLKPKILNNNHISIETENTRTQMIYILHKYLNISQFSQVTAQCIQSEK